MKILIALLLLVGLQTHADECDVFAAKGKNENEKFDKFLDTQWAYNMKTFPEWATYEGDPRYNDVWTDDSKEAIALRNRLIKCQVKILASFNPEKLSDANKLNLELARYQAELYDRQNEFDDEFLRVSQLEGWHIFLTDILSSAPALSFKDFQDRIARLEKFPVQLDQTVALLKEGLEKKVILPKILFKSIPAQFDPLLDPKIEKNPLFQSFKELPNSLTAQQKQEIQTLAKKVIAEKVIPALSQFRAFLIKDYFPKGRDTVGWKYMPNGIKWYEFNIKKRTTLDMTADELHQLGISEVARINKEMDEVRKKLKFKGTKQQFHKFLQTDPRFFYKNADEMLTDYRSFGKEVDPSILKLFSRLPRLPYGVRPIESFKAKSAPGAYYQGGSMEAGRAGYFELNTYAPKTRANWGKENLFFHEAVPGHHLQLALAQEIEGAPMFRRSINSTAFIEGWALYAESLGYDLGFYKDPYSQYGQLGAEMFRAVRLVVDTGLHAKDWSREQAIKYFQENVPEAKEATVEIDRYINWPGQALAYKVGELKFKELRAKAEKALGAQFNIREFHDQVLKNGSLPLPILEKLTDQWLKNKVSSLKK